MMTTSLIVGHVFSPGHFDSLATPHDVKQHVFLITVELEPLNKFIDYISRIAEQTCLEKRSGWLALDKRQLHEG